MLTFNLRRGRHPVLLAAVLSLWIPVPALAGDAPAQPATQHPACREAVINPVTRYAECVDPPGAPVAQIPQDVAPPCDAHAPSNGAFSMHSRCTPRHSAEEESKPRHSAEEESKSGDDGTAGGSR